MNRRLIQLNGEELHALSQEMRKSVFEICLNANNGHIGGCSGAVELLTTLYFGGILRHSIGSSRYDRERDRVLVRGHLGPLRYKIFSLLGYLNEAELDDYRKFGSRLHGHEDHLETPGVDITPSGSLGMLLSYGTGCAYAAKLNKESYRTFVFVGDGEEQEGNVSEAARHAAHLSLNNLIVVVDKNTKQLSNPTADTDSSDLSMIWRGYGWEVIVLDDGHDITKVSDAYSKALLTGQTKGKPVAIIACTNKGAGIDGHVAHFSGYHTISTCPSGVVKDAIEVMRLKVEALSIPLGAAKRKIASFVEESSSWVSACQDDAFCPVKLDIRPLPTTPPNPDACQLDYFRILENKIANGEVGNERLFFLTADVTRKDHVEQLHLERFCTFLNTGIREQHTIAMAHGLSLTLPKSRILVNSLDAFTYRSIDQLNAAVQGKSSMVVIGDVSGLTNSRNGKTHQTSGQPGALLMMPGVALLEPWDVIDTFNCLNWAIGESRGVVFIRIHSSNISSAPLPETVRSIKWYVLHEPLSEPDLTIVASGLTVGSALAATDILGKEGVMARVVNIVNHKSIDQSFAKVIADRKPLLTVYNGYAGVLQANVAKVLLESNCNIPSKMIGLGFDFGTTGGIDDLLQAYGLDANGIVRRVKKDLL